MVDGVVGAGRDEAYAPSVAAHFVVVDVEVAAAVDEQPHGVVQEAVAANQAVLQLLDQQPVGGGAKVVGEDVVEHRHVVAEHHGHPRLVVAEAVGVEDVEVGEHEVQPIARAAVDGVVGDARVVDKLQVDAVAVVANPVVFYPHVVALPAVDGVAHEGIEGDVARYVVVRHHAVTAVLNHDAELVGPEHASLHGQPRDSETVYAAVVDARRPPRVAQEQPREGHAVGPDLYDST